MTKYRNSFDHELAERQLIGPVLSNTKPAPKQMIAYQIAREMARQKLTRQEMADRMGTSRAALNRLLDPKNESITLLTLTKAAEVLKLEMVVSFSTKE